MTDIAAFGGFIQFGDGHPIPITNCTWTMDEPTALPEGTRLDMRNLADITIDVPVPSEVMVRIFRAIGQPETADHIEIATHPDLAELDAQIDGYYDGMETKP